MKEHLLHDYQHFTTLYWLIIVLIPIAAFLLFMRISQKVGTADLQLLDASNSTHGGFGALTTETTYSAMHGDVEAHDTVFIVPDISHYSRFIAGNHFSTAYSQKIIFSLINVIIEAASSTFELSKLEGDAALLFADAHKNSQKQIGRTIMAIFSAFYDEKRRLMESGYCSCKSCKHINDLDLKIFVHRGNAARFNFKGSVDHFGTDLIILHKLMKNSFDGSRYVMVTDAAMGSITLPADFECHQIEEELEHVGKIQASVFTFDNSTALKTVPRDTNSLNQRNLIPCGTGSDLCKTFGFGGDLQSAIKKIAAGREQLIDVGRLEFFSLDEKPVTRFFLNIVSFGLSGVISNNINHSNKFEMLPGKARYLIETLRALFDYDPVRIRIMVDDVEVEEDIMLGAVANGRYFGGGMMVAPNADPQDGQLDVVLLRAMSKARLALKIPHVYRGTHLNLAEVVSLRGSKLHIWALPTKDHKPVLLDVDGESPGHLDCKITVLSKALRLVV